MNACNIPGCDTCKYRWNSMKQHPCNECIVDDEFTKYEVTTYGEN